MNSITNRYDFRGIYTLDLANNHEGDVDHGLAIIREVGAVVAHHGVRAAVKFQFRDLEYLIHPAHRDGSDNKHIPRFQKNALSREAFASMASAVRGAGMITMATPFDEGSVDLIEELDIEVVKIASCSALDWPLLERVVEANRPLVVSTGGLTIEDIGNVVSYLDHRGADFALMHCVSVYPTPPDMMELNQIIEIKRRNPECVVGWSTHEDPDDTDPVVAAVALGAEMLERHVGLRTESTVLNAYSSTPEQVDQWIIAAEKTRLMLGADTRPPSSAAEQASLLSLKRGVFAARSLAAGDSLAREDVFFAMPAEDGQWTSGDWKPGLTVSVDVPCEGAIPHAAMAFPPPHPDEVLIHAIHDIKAMVNRASIAMPVDFTLEFSHHYGKDRFREVGAVLIDCINREYCKKLIIQLPGQSHPSHCHTKKEETFHVLYGTMEVLIDGRMKTLGAGDIMVVPRGTWHSFATRTGMIFEEISTTHFHNDSFYEDKNINRLEREARKTIVTRWGDYQWRETAHC